MPVLPFANADMMNLHLAETDADVAPGAQAVLTVDGAGWHRIGGRLRVAGNVTLLHLPPYNPEPPGQCPEAVGKRLGLPARQQARQPGVRHLRGHRRCLCQRVALPHW